jgi:hypothetical protein
MNYQYMIWRFHDGETHHIVFNQKTMRVVYPPSSVFYHSPIKTAIKFYEGKKYTLLDQGTWRGDKVHEYLQAMQKMYPKALPKDSRDK